MHGSTQDAEDMDLMAQEEAEEELSCHTLTAKTSRKGEQLSSPARTINIVTRRGTDTKQIQSGESLPQATATNLSDISDDATSSEEDIEEQASQPLDLDEGSDGQTHLIVDLDVTVDSGANAPQGGDQLHPPDTSTHAQHGEEQNIPQEDDAHARPRIEASTTEDLAGNPLRRRVMETGPSQDSR